jgi:hypothetical protein
MRSTASSARPHAIQRARKAQGMSLRRLGSLSSLPFRRICLFEHGLEVSDTELRLLAAALRVPLHRLSGRSK